MDSMKIMLFNANDMGQNIYLYYHEKLCEGIIIDAGCSEADIKLLSAFISDNRISIKGILLTHGHYDHIIGLGEMTNLTSAKVCSHEKEMKMLECPDINLSTRIGANLKVTPGLLFDDGDVYQLGDVRLQVLHTPGHTPGGVCYYDKDNNNLFTGDTLFKESIGRTDLPAGNHNELIINIKEKLFVLPNETRVYPGHGPGTTIGYEKQHNPYVR